MYIGLLCKSIGQVQLRRCIAWKEAVRLSRTQAGDPRRICVVADGSDVSVARVLHWALELLVRRGNDDVHILAVADHAAPVTSAACFL